MFHNIVQVVPCEDYKVYVYTSGVVLGAIDYTVVVK